MKIKKFRIRPRISTVQRILKTLLAVRQLPPDLEETLAQESETFLTHITPTAFYVTWSGENIPSSFQEILKTSASPKAVAVSVSALVATIGPGPEEVISDLLLNGETQRAQTITAFGEEAADQAFQFLLRLLSEEAQGDDCEVSDPVPVSDLALLGETLSLLEAEQEGISIDTASHLTPRFTRVGLVLWTPVKKRRPAATPSKKRAA